MEPGSGQPSRGVYRRGSCAMAPTTATVEDQQTGGLRSTVLRRPTAVPGLSNLSRPCHEQDGDGNADECGDREQPAATVLTGEAPAPSPVQWGNAGHHE